MKPIGPIVEQILIRATGFPSFEAEMGFAVARGTMTLTLAWRLPEMGPGMAAVRKQASPRRAGRRVWSRPKANGLTWRL